MATLLLRTVGTVFAGPLGGSIGGAVGRIIDDTIFPSSGRPLAENSGRDDLKVQSSALGTAIPLVYGRIRVAGNVIWSTDIRERRTETKQKSGGKGSKSSTTNVSFSYSVSLAVALSARPIVGIGRIWGDGKLLRDSTGALLSPVTIHIHRGEETQEIDPVIEAQTGVGAGPDLRGLAYVVLEDFELGEFANRIPNLGFEVIADQSPTIGSIASDLARRSGLGDIETAGLDKNIIGFAIGRETDARSAIDGLAASFPFIASEDSGRLRLTAPGSGGLAGANFDDLGTGPANGESVQTRLRRERDQGDDLPMMLGLRHADPDRDFQTSLQWARLQQGHALRRETIDSPLALAAIDAKTQAETLLALRWQRRERLRFSLPMSFATLTSGDRILLEGVPETRPILIEEISLRKDAIDIEGFPLSSLPGTPSDSASSGDFRPPQVLPPGDSVLEIIDLPGVGASRDGANVIVAMAGPSPGWRGAALMSSRDGEESFDLLLSTPVPAVMGTVIVPPGPGPENCFDEASTVVIRLLRPDLTLESRSTLAILNGANLAVIGDEVLQFREARLEGDGTWRLNGFLRARNGDETVIASHVAGERFVLLDDGGVLTLPLPFDAIGAVADVKAVTLGTNPDDVPARNIRFDAASLMPLAPVHIKGRRHENGDINISWIRRTRFDGGWRDGGDVPLNEDSESYLVEIMNGTSIVRSAVIADPSFLYSTGMQIADFGLQPDIISVRLRQISARRGPGLPGSASFSLS